MLYVGFISALVAIFPSVLLKMLGNQDESLVASVKSAIVPFAVGVSLDAMRYCLLQELTAVRYVNKPTAASIFGLGLGILLSWYLSGRGAFGIGSGYAIGMAFSVLLLAYQWWSNVAQTEKLSAHFIRVSRAASQSKPLLAV